MATIAATLYFYLNVVLVIIFGIGIISLYIVVWLTTALEVKRSIYNYKNFYRNNFIDIKKVESNKELMKIMSSNMTNEDVIKLSGYSVAKLNNIISIYCGGYVRKNILSIMFANYNDQLNINESNVTVTNMGYSLIIIIYIAFIMMGAIYAIAALLGVRL